MDADTLLFFSAHPASLPLFEALETWLLEAFPRAERRVGKTQISYAEGCVFACVSFLPVGRKARRGPVWLTYSLGLPEPLESPRAAVQTEPYPCRWIIHFLLRDPAELDGELLAWTRSAHAFALQKARGGRRAKP